MVRRKSSLRILMLTAAFLLVACNNKKLAKVAQPATPPLPPPAPTATLSAAPNSIQQGQSAVLNWNTSNATDITIEGLGVVPSSGSRSVTPSASTTYTLIAKGAGGTSQAVASITVNPVVSKAVLPDDGDLFAKNVNDVFFDFDDSKIRSNQAAVVERDGGYLGQHSNIKVLIEGHCDDRGSEMYNLALGERRANVVREALIKDGVDPSRIKTVSYGKEKPFCSQENEQCWQENRRDHVVAQR
ncbi:MAG TPA: peptidoglycan-associated lipoprotein Pal [Candidatus Angelobacter sp.]|nr:peptidoglycan-associated lipoprotein Pal [Candidatus Angelobacter sp.]